MAAPAHPSFKVMVGEAVKELKDRSGSSVPAICKSIGAWEHAAAASSLPRSKPDELASAPSRLAAALP